MCLFLRNVLYTIVYQISLPYTSYTRYTLYMTTICLCILEYPRFSLLEALYTMVYLIDPLYTLYTLYTSQKSAATHQNASGIPPFTLVYLLDLSYTRVQAREVCYYFTRFEEIIP